MNRPSRNFLRNKKREWEEYRSEVTAFELKNLLPGL
ncbi:glutamine synthetase [Streptomyces niveus]